MPKLRSEIGQEQIIPAAKAEDAEGSRPLHPLHVTVSKGQEPSSHNRVALIFPCR
jgi:hypothetical protein